VPSRHAIAQVTPYPWEDAHEVNAYVGALSRELCERGHRVLIVAPSRDPALVRESRRRIRAGELTSDDGAPVVLAVGEVLPALGPRRAVPSLPVDIARTIEELLETAQLDLVHVHEPFAPSAASSALRHSRALNVGTFHMPAERVLSTQVARRFVELFFGRLDARLASFQATADLLARSFPAHYEVITPGATVVERPAAVAHGPGNPVHIAFCALEERAALRVFLRALRRMDTELDWRVTIYAPGGIAPTSATRSKLRGRVQVLSEQDTTVDELLASADVVVAASQGQAPAPGLILRAIGAGAVPVVSHLGAYEEIVDDGEAGLLFDLGDVDVLAAQLDRVVGDADLRAQLAATAEPLRARLDWGRVATEVEGVYDRLTARRHDDRGDPEVRRRLQDRPLIDVDLHMHTDHSHDCATPVEALLAAARDRGLGAIAVTDHNELSGALEAQRKAADFGVKVIVGEEVKTAHQGEVIGLFLHEKIPRGLTLQETIAEIKRQGGLVYVPHPFDRLHAIPDYEHLLDVVEDIDAIEVFNPRIALPAFNEEAVRFAAKYRIVGGAGSDSHVAQGLGSVRIRMRDFDGPQEFLESLREADIVGRPSSLYYVGVQALKFLQTKATPPTARRAARERRVRKATRNR
jgi:glycosyltransferase involved in cell wall biosynthesis